VLDKARGLKGVALMDLLDRRGVKLGTYYRWKALSRRGPARRRQVPGNGSRPPMATLLNRDVHPQALAMLALQVVSRIATWDDAGRFLPIIGVLNSLAEHALEGA